MEIENRDVVSEVYDNYKETQAEILKIEKKKVRNSIFWIGGIFLLSSLLGLAVANTFTAQTLLYSLALPLLFIGLGFLSTKQPLLAIISATLVFIGYLIIEFTLVGGRAAISGWIIKAAIVYFLIAGFQSAREAERVRKEMA
jgi:hypothetical protein